MCSLFRRFLLLLPVPVLIALTNYAIDPASLFHPGTEYRVAQMMAQDRTVWGVDNYDERLVEKDYIERLQAAPQTIVLGSSRMMLVRGSMLSAPSFFNNSVSGASVEDLLAILGMYDERHLRPDRIIIGVDPWIFNRHNGQNRWMSVTDDYRYMAARLELESPSGWRAWRREAGWEWHNVPQLLSISYFQASTDALEQELAHGRAAVGQSQPIAAEGNNPSGRTILPDGSIAYPPSMYKSPEQTAQMAFDFATPGPPYSLEKFTELDGQSVTAFTRLVSHLRQTGADVELVLPPYHPVTYRLLVGNQDYRIIEEAERTVRAFAQSRGIPLVGSYDPTRAHCTADEFIDGMHARSSCMARILSGLRPATPEHAMR